MRININNMKNCAIPIKTKIEKKSLLWLNESSFIIGGRVMPGRYRHIKEYEKEILSLQGRSDSVME